MIVAILNQKANPDRAVVACNLAVLRAGSGRKVCLVDADSARRAYAWSIARSATGLRPWISARTVSRRGLQQDIEHLIPLFNDIVIDAGTRDTQACRRALIAAKLALVLVHADETDLASQYALIGRLNAARQTNPGLRVLFVMASGADAPNAEEYAAARAYASRVTAATLASAVLHEPALHDYGAGRCVFDAESCDPELAAEIRALYGEVFAPAPVLGTALANIR